MTCPNPEEHRGKEREDSYVSRKHTTSFRVLILVNSAIFYYQGIFVTSFLSVHVPVYSLRERARGRTERREGSGERIKGVKERGFARHGVGQDTTALQQPLSSPLFSYPGDHLGP